MLVTPVRKKNLIATFDFGVFCKGMLCPRPKTTISQKEVLSAVL